MAGADRLVDRRVLIHQSLVKVEEHRAPLGVRLVAETVADVACRVIVVEVGLQAEPLGKADQIEPVGDIVVIVRIGHIVARGEREQLVEIRVVLVLDGSAADP